MKDTDHDRQPAPFRKIPATEASLVFAGFVLAHSGCGEETSELRLDKGSLIGWCRRCDDLRIFVNRGIEEGKPVRAWSPKEEGQGLDFYRFIRT